MISSYQEKRKIQDSTSGGMPLFRLGIISETAEDGRCGILFDGETEASGKLYAVLRTGADLAAGDRVLCLAVSGSWVVLGSIVGGDAIPAAVMAYVDGRYTELANAIMESV